MGNNECILYPSVTSDCGTMSITQAFPTFMAGAPHGNGHVSRAHMAVMSKAGLSIIRLSGLLMALSAIGRRCVLCCASSQLRSRAKNRTESSVVKRVCL